MGRTVIMKCICFQLYSLILRFRRQQGCSRGRVKMRGGLKAGNASEMNEWKNKLSFELNYGSGRQQVDKRQDVQVWRLTERRREGNGQQP